MSGKSDEQTSLTPRDRLHAAGRLMFGEYGSDWSRPMGFALAAYHPYERREKIDDRLVRRWVSGARDVEPWVIKALPALIRKWEMEVTVRAAKALTLADEIQVENRKESASR